MKIAIIEELTANLHDKVDYQFNEDFIKNYNADNDEGNFFKVDVQYSEKLHEFHNDLPFLQKRMKIQKSKSLWIIYMMKLNML